MRWGKIYWPPRSWWGKFGFKILIKFKLVRIVLVGKILVNGTIDILHLIGIGNGLRVPKYACFEFPYM